MLEYCKINMVLNGLKIFKSNPYTLFSCFGSCVQKYVVVKFICSTLFPTACINYFMTLKEKPHLFYFWSL